MPGTAAPIEGPVSLQVTVHRTSPKRRELTFTVDCARQTATCTGFRQNWTMLVPPVVEGSDCLGPFGRDSVTVSGSVAGVPVERSYDICYGRVIQGWEKLLGVAPPSRR